MLAWRLCAITLLATLVAACGTGGEGGRQPVSTDIDRGSTTTIVNVTVSAPESNQAVTFDALRADLAGRCPVDVPMAAGVVADPPIPDGSEGLKVPMFVGVLQDESARRVVYDGEITSIQPSPNSDGAAWVRVASPGIVTIYQVDPNPPLTVGNRLTAGDELGPVGSGLYFVRFETHDGIQVDGIGVLEHVGCDLSPDPITTIDAMMLDGSEWQIVLSAPIVAGVVAQPDGRLEIDGGYLVDVTIWTEPPDPSRSHLSPVAPAEVLEVFHRADGLRAETWRFDTGVENGYLTWIESPAGEAVMFTSGSPHDFASELIGSLTFEGDGLRIDSDRFAITDQQIYIGLYDPSALFGGADLTISIDCIISARLAESCGPPSLKVSTPAPSQTEALHGARVQPSS